MKKKYYLEGNPYDEYSIDDSIDKICAQNIYAKLKEKGYLGNISVNELTWYTADYKRKKLYKFIYNNNLWKRF